MKYNLFDEFKKSVIKYILRKNVQLSYDGYGLRATLQVRRLILMEKRLQRKSILAVLLAMFMTFSIAGVATMFADFSGAAEADETEGPVSVWDGDLIAAGWGDEEVEAPAEYKVTYVNGSSGKISKVEIGSAAAFAWFSHEVYMDGGDKSDTDDGTYYLDDAVVTLTVDIDLDNKMWIPIGRTGREYELGQSYKRSRFSGTFDGGNHTIYNFSTKELADSFKCIPASGDVKEQYYNEYTYTGSKSYTNKTAKIPVTLRSKTEYSYGLFSLAYNLTVKNLNVVGVDINITEMQLGGAKPVVPDSVGVIAGFATGNVTIDNCTIGTTKPGIANSIVLDKDDSGCAGGLIGRLYANDGAGTSGANTRYLITNCVNYVDFETHDQTLKIGGMVGQINYGLSSKIENCINYGDIKGGRYLGGIVGFWQPNKGSQTATFSLIDCDNFGNIVTMSTAGDAQVAGLANVYRSTNNLTLLVDGCNNYGNIGGTNFVGGILGTIFGDSIPNATILTNNYNYGNVYCYGTGAGYTVSSSGALLYQKTFAGGLVAFMNSGYSDSKKLIVTGGNLGTVYGTADYIDSTLSRGASNAINTDADGYYLVSAGQVEHMTKEEMASKFATMPDSEFTEPVIERQFGAVSRKVKASGEYEGEYEIDIDTGAFTYEYEYTDGTFAYSDDSFTTIIGVAEGADVSGTISIPASVTTIGASAFAGHSEIKAVEFEGNDIVIDDFAFAGTGITSLELSANLKTVGNAAFGGIATLNNVTLLANANSISLGTGVFSGTRTGAGAFIIATGSAQYWQLSQNSGYSQSGGILTYKVTIDYVYDGEKLDGASETRLHGQKYSVTLQEGVWADRELSFSGPSSHSGAQWFDSADRSNGITEDYLYNLLGADTEIITLYAYSESDGTRWFYARTGIVYDKNKTYTVNELNMLLYPSSDTIDLGTMEVTIKYGGDTVDSIHDAGEYTVEVKEDQKTYNFKIYIEKATLNLADLANLEWQLEGANTELMSSTLYIYKDADGNDYPSLQILDAKQMEALNISEGSYKVSIVNYSVVRNRGTNTIVIIGDGYTVEYNNDDSAFTNVSSKIGSYVAKATLTATKNYVFTVGNINTLRGLTIELGEDDNTTATVTKEWYVVDLGNAIILTSYDHTYGDDNYTAVAPVLQYEDAYNPGYVEEISMTLTRNGETIGTFGVSNFTDFINKSMPAGDYRLSITIPAVTAKDPTDNVDVYLSGYTETFTFTVANATLLPLDSVNTALKDKTFELKDGDNTVYNTTAAGVVGTYISQAANLSRTGEWAKADYADLYGNFVIRFNLAGNDVYSETINVTAAGEYTVYYEIYALNYNSSIEGVSRYDYKFTLIKYHVVDIPDVSENNKDLTYTGSTVLPTVAESEYYEVIWMDSEYVTGGTHHVKLSLYDAKLTRWAGHEEDKLTEVVVDYEVKAADNGFTVSLNMLGWSYEGYSVANNIRAILKFGTVDIIKFTVTLKTTTTAINSTLENFTISADGAVEDEVAEELNKLDAGSYVLRATIAGNTNYNGFKDQVEFTVLKASNAWATGDEDLILPSWIVGQYKKDENPIVVNAEHGDAQYRIEDIDGNVYYDSTDENANLEEALNKMAVGKYLLIAWVNETANFSKLEERSFTIQVLERVGLPWWATLLITVGALAVAALILFILWKKGVFQILTEKLFVAIRTRASVEATIASVRAAKMMEEGRQSVAEAKRRERLEELRKKAQEEREMSPEERAAKLEAKAQVDAAKAEKLRKRSEAAQKRADKMRSQETNSANGDANNNPETPTEE